MGVRRRRFVAMISQLSFLLPNTKVDDIVLLQGVIYRVLRTVKRSGFDITAFKQFRASISENRKVECARFSPVEDVLRLASLSISQVVRVLIRF